jgi:hypothetical protein
VNEDSNLDTIDNPPFLTPTPDKDPMRAIREGSKIQKVPSLNPKLPNDGFELKGEDDDNSLEDGGNLILMNDKINYTVKPSLIEQVQKNMFRQYKQDVKVRMGDMDDGSPVYELPNKIQDRNSKLVPNKIGHDHSNLGDREEMDHNDSQPLPTPIPPVKNSDRSLNTDEGEQYQYKKDIKVKDKEIAKYKELAESAISIAQQLQEEVNKSVKLTKEMRQDPDFEKTLLKYGKKYM